jgi:hypothetical protein
MAPQDFPGQAPHAPLVVAAARGSDVGSLNALSICSARSSWASASFSRACLNALSRKSPAPSARSTRSRLEQKRGIVPLRDGAFGDAKHLGDFLVFQTGEEAALKDGIPLFYGNRENASDLSTFCEKLLKVSPVLRVRRLRRIAFPEDSFGSAWRFCCPPHFIAFAPFGRNGAKDLRCRHP